MLKLSNTIRKESIFEIKKIEMQVKKIKPMILKNSNNNKIVL